MDRTQLLNITRRQKLEIEKLTAEKEELAKRFEENGIIPAGNENAAPGVQEMTDIFEKNVRLLEDRNIEREIVRAETGREVKRIVLGTIRNIIVIAAVVIVLTNLVISVLIAGRTSGMSPALKNGDILVTLRWVSVKPGDVAAFYYNNKIMLKRIIAKAGDWVNIDEDGAVSVNGEVIDEPYLTEKSWGPCDIELPYQVPDGSFFVMGDARSESTDSRLSEIGPVSKDRVLGKVILRVWPLPGIGFVG